MTDPDLERSQVLLEQVARGENEALGELYEHYGERLRRMIRLRVDPRVRARIDEADVIQETFVEAAERLDNYRTERPMPLFLWLRFLAFQRLGLLHRHHLGVQARDARKEVRLDPRPLSEASSHALAAGIAAHLTTPTQGAVRKEVRERLQEALDGMQAPDREVLALRHFEQLSNVEVAHELGIDAPAASKRYVRALARLKTVLAGALGGFDLRA